MSSSLAKPARRSAKPRRPIRRSAAKGKRTSKRRKQRKAGKALCDRLWARVIKEQGICTFVGQVLSRGEDEEGMCPTCEQTYGFCTCLDPVVTVDWAREPHICRGPLQAMHCIPKGPYPSARYKLWNGIPGCAGAHTYYTHRPELFVLWLQSRWGDALYAERLRDANYPAKHDYAAIAAKLQERLP